MTGEPDNLSVLIRDLIAAFTLHPDALSVTSREHPARVYWVVKAHADDTPRVRGKRQSHLHALSVLVREFGRESGKLHTVEILEPDPAPVQARAPDRLVDRWDPEPTRLLLERCLEALGVGEFAVEAEDRGGHEEGRLRFNLAVHVRSEEDERLLVGSPPDGLLFGMNTVAALGTIFRAAANREGVKVTLEVRRT